MIILVLNKCLGCERDNQHGLANIQQAILRANDPNEELNLNSFNFEDFELLRKHTRKIDGKVFE